MPTPVGPLPPDPDDPDLWSERDGDPWDDDAMPPRRPRSVWLKLAAVVLLAGFVLLFVFG